MGKICATLKRCILYFVQKYASPFSSRVMKEEWIRNILEEPHLELLA